MLISTSSLGLLCKLMPTRHLTHGSKMTKEYLITKPLFYLYHAIISLSLKDLFTQELHKRSTHGLGCIVTNSISMDPTSIHWECINNKCFGIDKALV